ncbi:MAG: NAD(P)H-dependent oxidoreductase [Rhizobiaceae bacterium]
MKAHIVLAHPERKSFNGKLADTSKATLEANGFQTTVSDLYGMDFDPREAEQHYTERSDTAVFHAQTEQRFNANNGTTPADVNEEADKLLNADVLIVHFPLWWFGAPAILKGWMDRVFVYGKVYKSKMRYDAGICRGKKMIACITTGASADSCSFDGREGDTRLVIWPLLFPFRYIGFDVLEPVIMHGIGGVASIEAHEDGMSNLDRYEANWKAALSDLNKRTVVPFNVDSDFDENKRLHPTSPSHSPFVSHKRATLW